MASLQQHDPSFIMGCLLIALGHFCNFNNTSIHFSALVSNTSFFLKLLNKVDCPKTPKNDIYLFQNNTTVATYHQQAYQTFTVRFQFGLVFSNNTKHTLSTWCFPHICFTWAFHQNIFDDLSFFIRLRDQGHPSN